MMGNKNKNSGRACQNLGPKEIRKRKIFGWLMILLASLASGMTLLFNAQPFFYLLISLLFFLGFLGILQAKRGICVIYAARGVKNFDRGVERISDPSETMQLGSESKAIYLKALLFSLFLIAILMFIRNHMAESAEPKQKSEENAEESSMENVQKTEDEWKKILSPEQYQILRKKGTERAFTGKYYNHHAKGVYRCAACGNVLFASETKFESGTGWPSFWQPLKAESVEVEEDLSLGMDRTEVRCAKCGGHLGHIFDDGPAPTHQRYCINSAALNFKEEGSTNGASLSSKMSF